MTDYTQFIKAFNWVSVDFCWGMATMNTRMQMMQTNATSRWRYKFSRGPHLYIAGKNKGEVWGEHKVVYVGDFGQVWMGTFDEWVAGHDKIRKKYGKDEE